MGSKETTTLHTLTHFEMGGGGGAKLYKYIYCILLGSFGNMSFPTFLPTPKT
jgi:hypothetical protein